MDEDDCGLPAGDQTDTKQEPEGTGRCRPLSIKGQRTPNRRSECTDSNVLTTDSYDALHFLAFNGKRRFLDTPASAAPSV